jgi:peptide chain release factor 1
VQLVISGDGARSLFANESGGHRWQRIPPTEKRGRVQTSTVTVAVLTPESSMEPELNATDISIVATRGSGPGGQNRNKVASCIVATHRPTGISVRIDSERSQNRNRATALAVLEAKVGELERSRVAGARAADRKAQVGSGMRGDKVRTYRVQDDNVVDHRSGRRWRLREWIKGEW